tara:strand:- start:279 stop:1199 length:921 start_codon:yes stop_codon:yes gene_type:complete
MCGLAGIVLKQESRAVNQTALAIDGFRKMLVSAESRGHHSTGFAVIDASSEFYIHKAPRSASEFVNKADTLSALELVDSETSVIMGHTRYGTKGSRYINANNHPIRTQTVIGTHNGSVQNDDELFDKFDMNRFAEVDSEVLFRLFATSSGISDFIKNRLPIVRGRVSMVWADTENPDIVYLYKGNNPLECAYSPEYRAIFYGSTKEIVDSSKVSDLQYMTVDENTLMMIDTKTLKIKKQRVSVTAPVYKNRTYNHKIGAYEIKTRKNDYSHTTKKFVPRFSFSDQLQMFKKIKASDGSTIKLRGEK